MNPPQHFGERNPDDEWRTIRRLSGLLFGISLAVTALASQFFDIGVLGNPPSIATDVLTGLAASSPMLGGLLLLRKSSGVLSRQLWDVPVELLGPALNRSSQIGLAGIALMAGIGEELVFRGVLHGWLSPAGPTVALIVPNVLFGALHYVNATYAVAAGVTGLYFSILLHFVPDVSLYSLMVAHAFYDYVALNCLTARVRSCGLHSRGQEPDETL